MGIMNRSCVALALVAVSCATVSAQEFDPAKIRLGQTVVVRDASGFDTKGVVQSVEPSKLVVKYGVGRLSDAAAPAPPGTLLNDSRAFAPADVARVRRPAPVWDGALKGALIGLVAPMVAVGGKCEACGGIYLMTAGIGAGIGLGIDAAFPAKTVYRRSAAPRTMSIVPTLSRNGGGIAGTLRF